MSMLDSVTCLKLSSCGADRQGELIVRHLLMPGHYDCCWRPMAVWLAAELPHVKLSLRAAFWPAWRADRHPELRGTVTAAAGRAALADARALGLTLSASDEGQL